jgi:hypothetical protein
MTRRFILFFCEHCQKTQRFTKRFPDFSRHLLATILTFGLWGIAWYVLHRQEAARPWRCCVCSRRQMPRNAPLAPRPSRQRITIAPLAVVAPRANF